MKKAFSESDCRRIHSNLLMQDIYVRDISLPKDVRTEYGADQYYELQRKPLENGIGFQEVLTPVDYPITPESVKSQASSCDYKIDPVGAIARGQSRKNLGDITEMQKLLQFDSAEMMSLYQHLKEVFEKSSDGKVDSTSQSDLTPQSDPTPQSGNGGNV